MARTHTRRRGVNDTVSRWKRFFRDYTDGVSGEDLRRLFDRDVTRAYSILARDQVREAEPAKGLRRLVFRTRIFFLGLSSKLTPARRVLFGAALVLALLGLVQVRMVAEGGRVVVTFSPMFLLASVAALVYLLALELVDRIVVRDELEVARQLQDELLPDTAPALPGYRFAHSYRTANEIGGDYYDFLTLPDGRVVLVAGDASGHGMAAGLLMAIASATLKVALDVDPAPASVAGLMNRAVCRAGTMRNFMSLFYAVLDPASGSLEYFCAGHPFPLLRRADGSVEELGRGCLPLGIRRDLDIETRTASVAPGDLLVVYSDGLPEAMKADGQAFGFDRVRALVADGGRADAVHLRLVRALERFLGEDPLLDDVSLVVVTREVEPPPPPRVLQSP